MNEVAKTQNTETWRYCDTDRQRHGDTVTQTETWRYCDTEYRDMEIL